MYIRVPAHAALGETTGPLAGTFVGEFKGDGDTKTSITAVLTHHDSVVAGTITLGSGLRLGFPKVCGIESVDVKAFEVKGTQGASANQGVVSGAFDEPTTQFGPLKKSITIDVSIAGTLVDANTLSTKVTMKPRMWGCTERPFDVTLWRKV